MTLKRPIFLLILSLFNFAHTAECNGGNSLDESFSKRWIKSQNKTLNQSLSNKQKTGYYFENAFRATAVQGSSVNRGSIAAGSTYQMKFCYNNEIKTKKDIYRVLVNNNDFMVEGIRSKDNKFNMGFLFSSSWYYRIQDVNFCPLIGVHLRASPASNNSYSFMPIIGVSGDIIDYYYGYSTKISGIYSGYSVHNFGMVLRFSELSYLLQFKS